MCHSLGAQGWEAIQEGGLSKQTRLQQPLGGELHNGIPTEATFRRVLSRLDPQAFQTCFLAWIQAIQTHTQGEVIALDGKTRRHCFDTATGPKAIHLVSAWVSHHRLVLGQVKVDEKSNEITALPVFFAWLDIGGCILTSEARGCQTAIAKPIVEQKGDYLLALKGHPESIHQLSPLHPFTPSFRAALPPGDFLEGA